MDKPSSRTSVARCQVRPVTAWPDAFGHVSGTLSGTCRRSTSAPSSWLNVSDTISKVRFFGGEARFGFGRRDERVSVDDSFGLGTTGRVRVCSLIPSM